jgi:hypothetical protein
MPGPTIRDVKSASGQASSIQLAAFSSNPVNGDCIIAVAGRYQSAGLSVFLPTDTAGNTYIQLGTTKVSSGNNTLSMWMAKNITGGSTFRVTGSWQGASHFAFIAWVLTNVDKDPYNSDWIGTTGSATSVDAGPSVVAPKPNSLFIGALAIDGASVPNDGTGWNTEGANGFTAGMHTAAKVADYTAHFDAYTEYKISSVVTSAQWVQGGLPWSAMQASFKEPQPSGFSCLSLAP